MRFRFFSFVCSFFLSSVYFCLSFVSFFFLIHHFFLLQRDLCCLQGANLFQMSDDEKTAFYINIYNTLTLHLFIYASALSPLIEVDSHSLSFSLSLLLVEILSN